MRELFCMVEVSSSFAAGRLLLTVLNTLEFTTGPSSHAMTAKMTFTSVSIHLDVKKHQDAWLWFKLLDEEGGIG